MTTPTPLPEVRQQTQDPAAVVVSENTTATTTTTPTPTATPTPTSEAAISTPAVVVNTDASYATESTAAPAVAPKSEPTATQSGVTITSIDPASSAAAFGATSSCTTSTSTSTTSSSRLMPEEETVLEEYPYAVGIDLGTTYSCIGVWEDERVVLIPNEVGNVTTPSYVAFTDRERVIGEAAYAQSARNPRNTVHDSKRLIGRSFSDPSVQSDMKLWPFRVVNRDGRPYIVVDYLNSQKEFSPEEISSMVLSKLKADAEQYLNKRVTKAVITCPAYFNDSQRQATKDAGAIAGLEVIRVFNEPTAAAVAYSLDSKGSCKNILIFDLGGGTFDVSVLVIESGVFSVKATGGNTHLGGEDFDNRLVDYVLKEFKLKTKQDVNAPRALRRLRTACEKAKRVLSSQQSTVIEVEQLVEGFDLKTTITRQQFELMNKDLFIEAMNVVYSVLKDAKMDKKFIDEVVLVGGSTRIPKVQTMLRELFGKEPNRGINPDEAVAFGAVMQAAVLSGLKNNKMELMVLLDVAPLSLGVETSGGIFSAVVKRNTTIPCQATKVYTTEEDNQTTVEFPVYEGERKLARDNHHLGTFSLTGLLPAKRGIPQLMVTFELNANSILSVTAVDKATGRSANIVISQRGTLSKTDVERMVLDAERYKNEDANNLKRAKLRNELDEFCYTISSAMDEFGAKVDGPLKKQAKAALEDCRQWLEEQGDSATKNQLQARMGLLDAAWQPLVRQLYGSENAPTSRGSGTSGSGVSGSRHRQQQQAPQPSNPITIPTPTPTPTPMTAPPMPQPSNTTPQVQTPTQPQQPTPTTPNNSTKTKNNKKKNKNKGRKPKRH
ncbi:hypothetical protein Pelo_16092 [Pelomyxa schiedti]|nr:hypothetical protein Pelo_16092 [Pelomyxa schiedti]